MSASHESKLSSSERNETIPLTDKEIASDSIGNDSWWGGWLTAAKQKSVSAFEVVKKDLAEFTTTMQNDTTNAANQMKSKLTHEAASATTRSVKEGVSNLLGGISKVLSVPEREEEQRQGKRRPANEPIFDKMKARLRAIQLDPQTYCSAPAGSKELYDEWLKTFNVDNRKGEMSELLVTNVEVRSLYTQLVPLTVSHADFWQRYFYKLHQLELDEARRAALIQRASVATTLEHKNATWEEDDEDSWGDIGGPSSPSLPADVNGRSEANIPQTSAGQGVKGGTNVTETSGNYAAANDSNPRTGNILSEPISSEVNLFATGAERHGFTSSDAGCAPPLDVAKSDSKVSSVPELLSTGISQNGSQDSYVEISSRECYASSSLTAEISGKSGSDTTGGAEDRNSGMGGLPSERNSSLDYSGSGSGEITGASGPVDSPSEFSEGGAEFVEGGTQFDGQIAPDEAGMMEKHIAQLSVNVRETEGVGLVVVSEAASSGGTSPHSLTSGNKESSTSNEEEWEKEFEVEVTEEDLQAVKQEARKARTTAAEAAGEEGDDWENWE